jgi:hypothetical protein
VYTLPVPPALDWIVTWAEASPVISIAMTSIVTSTYLLFIGITATRESFNRDIKG